MIEDLGEYIVFTGAMIFLQYFKVHRENRSLNAEAWSKASGSNWPHSPKWTGSLKYLMEKIVGPV